MKHSSYFFIIVLFLFAQCEKDNELDYPDLSHVGNISSEVLGNGAWILTYQDIDSISKDSIVYLDKDWPNNSIGSYNEFWLVRVDNSNRKYLHITEFSVNSSIHKHVDTIYISKEDNLIKLNTYQESSFTTMPIKEGTFIGRYNQNYKRIEGFYRHTVFYRIGSVPGPGGANFRSAIANVNAFCE